MVLLQLDIYWYWWMFACTLFLMEMLVPDIFFMSLAIAAVFVGLLLLIFPQLNFPWQFFAFSMSSIIGLFISRLYLTHTQVETDAPLLNRPNERFIGRVFTLTDPVIDGVGQIKADSSYWNVTGPDCPAGTRVRVVGVSGIVLKIKPIETAQS